MKKYEVVFWGTSQDREQGESTRVGTYNNLLEAVEQCRALGRQYASSEVRHTSNHEHIYFVGDGVEDATTSIFRIIYNHGTQAIEAINMLTGQLVLSVAMKTIKDQDLGKSIEAGTLRDEALEDFMLTAWDKELKELIEVY